MLGSFASEEKSASEVSSPKSDGQKRRAEKLLVCEDTTKLISQSKVLAVVHWMTSVPVCAVTAFQRNAKEKKAPMKADKFFAIESADSKRKSRRMVA